MRAHEHTHTVTRHGRLIAWAEGRFEFAAGGRKRWFNALNTMHTRSPHADGSAGSDECAEQRVEDEDEDEDEGGMGSAGARARSHGRARNRRLTTAPLAKEAPRPTRRHCVCMVCDFFHPSVGGVEQHIWSLSQSLMRLGCRVIVVTHAYGACHGVRHMAGGLKVFYTPMTPFILKVALPTYTALLPIVRDIEVREGVTIVHGHQVRFVSAVGQSSWGGVRFVFENPALHITLASLLCRPRPRWRMSAFCTQEPLE